MKSVADELRAETLADVMSMTTEERVALSWRLGDEAIANLAATRGVTKEEAARIFRAQRRAGRRYSKCIEDLENADAP